jgi:mRNA interferase MazF
VTLPQRRGHVQAGTRYVVVVQSDELIGLSTVLTCPTSTSVRAASFRPNVVIDGTRTRVLCEQVQTIDARRLGRHAGHLRLDEIRAVDAALELVLDLGR